MTNETKRVVGIAAAEKGPIAPDCTCRGPAAEAISAATGTIANLTCIRCPLGCALAVEISPAGEVMGVAGNQCARGARYGADEATNPLRTVTACVCVPGALEPLSAKTLGSVPRNRVREVAKAIAALQLRLPVHCGDVLSENIANTGVAVVATKDLE